jgi:uncharacterized protein YeaO (DUF488 family)
MITVGRKPEQGEYVGRPSPLGNPFVMKKEADRDSVCDEYETWFYRQIQNRTPAVIAELERLHALAQTKPVKLICYCAPKRCHADTIAKFLNLHL